MKKSFISDVLNDILKTTESFKNVTFILPSQRAKIFLKRAITSKITFSFLPEMLSIEEFISKVSKIEKIDSINLLFHFYSIYKKVEKQPVSFDAFASWAFTALQDFNEIDQNLIKTKEFFLYLKDIQRLKKWSVHGEIKETELIKSNYSFLEKLAPFYDALYEFLKEKNLGYQGLIYREACKKIDAFLEKHSYKRHFFIGFNALNKAEEYIFQKVLNFGNADIYWDIDSDFYNSNHQAGKFIRKYKSTWNYYFKKDIKFLGNTFSESKNIKVIGVSKNITQIKYVGEILQKINDFSSTALVLADNSLLPIVLNSLPKNVKSINITMGYPLKNIPLVSLFYSVFQLFISQERLDKIGSNEFYYKDFTRFIRHPNISGLLPNINRFCNKIAKHNIIYINKTLIDELLEKTDVKHKSVIKNMFSPFASIDGFIYRILELISLLKEEVDELEREYFIRFYSLFSKLETLQKEHKYFYDIKILSLFFKQLIASESLAFTGEPLRGLQLMGMLETRALDFDNVILVSANEGILPASNQQNSFIPFDVKLEYGLPTYKDKDSIFSYHFFRLLQRAKNIFITYNNELDSYGSGEKSRFVKQLEMSRNDVLRKTITPKVSSDKIELKEIIKNESIFEELKILSEKGISPSVLTSYLQNPIEFYKNKILHINRSEEAEEIVAFNTLGNIVHKTLYELYAPFVDRFLELNDVELIKKKYFDIAAKHFKKEFGNSDINTGKNLLIFEVVKRFIYNFLLKEAELLKDTNNKLKILSVEEKLETEINIDGIEFPIKIHGIIDRIDELNGVIRIIDYKTGMVNKSELKVIDFKKLKDRKQYKAIQVLLYAFIYIKSKKHNFNQPLQAGIYSFKNSNSGFLFVNFSSDYKIPKIEIKQGIITDFISEITKYIKEIFDIEFSFNEPV